MLLTGRDVPALVRGASVLGSGGGGDAATAGAMVRRALGSGSVELVDDPAALPGGGGACVVPVGLVGATSVFAEELPAGTEFDRALATVERWTGQRADALITTEAAGVNGVTALLTAVGRGLPVLDVDPCWRALPRLDQFSLAVEGLSLTPLALCPPGGSVVVLDEADPRTVERTVRSVLAASGGWAAVALAPQPADRLWAAGMPGTTAACLELGRALLALPDGSPAEVVAGAAGGRLLAAGRVVDVTRSGGVGFGRGSLTVRDHRTNALLRVEMENEYLVALEDGRPVATTPDVIALLGRRTAEPVLAERVRRGDDVVVVQVPSPAFWRAPHRLPSVAPRAFGIDLDPVLSDPVLSDPVLSDPVLSDPSLSDPALPESRRAGSTS